MLVRGASRFVRATVPKLAAVARLATGAEKLSDEELRERVRRAVASASREELVSLFQQLPASYNVDNSSKAPPVRATTEQSANIELKVARVNPYGTGCYATRDFKAGDVISTIRGTIDNKPDFESIQIREGQHLHMERPEVFLNHSCEPNGYVDFETMEYRALTDIKKGDQLTWNYNSSEWELQRPFRCQCGAKIRGFKHLVREEQDKLIDRSSPYIKSQLQKLKAAA